MSANDNIYRDNNFNLEKANSYTLLLKLNADNFSYAVVHNNSLLVFAEKCALTDLDDQGQLFNLLPGDYKKVIVGLPATGLTLVPESLFNEEQVANYARLLDVAENEVVFAQPLDDSNHIVYKTGSALTSAVDKFGIKNAVYAAKGWIAAIALTNPSSGNLYIDISGDSAQFLHFSYGSLRFYNTFKFNNADELVYFTALVAKELSLDATNSTLILSGEVTQGDKNMSRLAEFFGKVELNNIHVLELPAQIPSHSLLALAALSLCGSLEVN